MVASGTDPAACPRAQATSSVTLGRVGGLGFRQRATTSRKAGEKSAGSATASLRSPQPEGGQRVSASNRQTPSAQISPAVELLPCRPSGGWYTLGALALIVSSPTRRIV